MKSVIFQEFTSWSFPRPYFNPFRYVCLLFPIVSYHYTNPLNDLCLPTNLPCPFRLIDEPVIRWDPRSGPDIAVRNRLADQTEKTPS